MTLNEVRNDLREIKTYYGNKELFEEYIGKISNENITNLVNKYNEAIGKAPARFYLLYLYLYVKDMTQETAGNELGWTENYIYKENAKLLVYFKNYFDSKGEENLHNNK